MPLHIAENYDVPFRTEFNGNRSKYISKELQEPYMEARALWINCDRTWYVRGMDSYLGFVNFSSPNQLRDFSPPFSQVNLRGHIVMA